MQIRAKLKYTRTAPRKVRLAADLVRGKRVKDARTILGFTFKKSADTILKLLNQAVSNAKNNFKIQENNLYILKIIVDGGPILKRSRPRARGSAYEIQKKTSHITIILKEIEKEQEKNEIEKTKESSPEKTDKILKPTKEKIKSPSFAKATESKEKEILKPQPQKPTRKIFRRQTF